MYLKVANNDFVPLKVQSCHHKGHLCTLYQCTGYIYDKCTFRVQKPYPYFSVCVSCLHRQLNTGVICIIISILDLFVDSGQEMENQISKKRNLC